MDTRIGLSQLRVCVRGGGDVATGVIWRLHVCGFRTLVTEILSPLAVRRRVAFSEAVYDGTATVEGVEAVRIDGVSQLEAAWAQRKVPVLVDPECRTGKSLRPDVIVDGILAKENLGTSIRDAPVVIGLGPGFATGVDVHYVVETNRGPNLGRLLTSGSAEPDTGVPGAVQGIASDRVIRAPGAGTWLAERDIGDTVEPGARIGAVSGAAVQALIGGVIRGMIRPGIEVRAGMKIGDIDPRAEKDRCFRISEKALAVGGGVLEGILRFYAG